MGNRRAQKTRKSLTEREKPTIIGENIPHGKEQTQMKDSTIWYRMRLKEAQMWIGPYQTDREDFIKLWHHVKKDVKRCYVWRYNDDDPPTVWAWDDTYFKGQWVECLGDVSNIAKP